jgi:hypothetical protein
MSLHDLLNIFPPQPDFTVRDFLSLIMLVLVAIGWQLSSIRSELRKLREGKPWPLN